MFKKVSTVLVAFFVLAPLASAGIVVDVVSQNEKVNWGGSYSYTHDLNDNGFQLGTALSGVLDVEIYDDQHDAGWWLWRLELSALKVENQWTQLTWGSNFSTQISGEAVASINDDGMLDVTIKSFWGDFIAGDSTLTVTTTGVNPVVTTASVSEPAVLMLLGVGLVGLRLARPKASA